MTAQLYRHYDRGGELLYIGISLNALRRLSDHGRSAPWFTAISRVEIEAFESRDAAARAEIVAIKTEKPKFNIVHNKGKIRAGATPDLRQTMFAWTPSGVVKVGQWPDNSCWSDECAYTDGACWTKWRNVSKRDTLTWMMRIVLATMIDRDCVDRDSAHRAFLNFKEYRERPSMWAISDYDFSEPGKMARAVRSWWVE